MPTRALITQRSAAFAEILGNHLTPRQCAHENKQTMHTS